MPVAQDGGGCGHLLPDILHRMPRLKLHIEVHHHAEQHDGDDDRAADRIAEHDRNGAGRQQDQDQGIGKEAQETDQTREARLSHQAVRAVKPQPLFRLGGSQSGWRCLDQAKQVLQGQVPEAVQGRVWLHP